MRRNLGFILAVIAILVGAGLTLGERWDRSADRSVIAGGTSTSLPVETTPDTTEPPLMSVYDQTAPSEPDPTTTAAPATTAGLRPEPTTTAGPAPTAPPATEPAPTTTDPPALLPVSTDGTFERVGTWLDVFDFNPAHSNNAPRVTPRDVETMAEAGVRTLYIQAARPEDPKAPGDLVSPQLLEQFVVRAHARNIRVVAWYLPHFSNLDDDMRHLSAMLAFRAGGRGFDGIGLDIEWRAAVADPAVRSARVVELAQRVRNAAGGRPVAAIVLPPVLLDVVNPAYWPNFPWTGLKPYVDAWIPMSYWTNRTIASGFRNAHHNTHEDVRRLRGHVGDVPIHVVGGIGDTATAADYRGFASALDEMGIQGRSIYDWATGGPASVTGIRS